MRRFWTRLGVAMRPWWSRRFQWGLQRFRASSIRFRVIFKRQRVYQTRSWTSMELRNQRAMISHHWVMICNQADRPLKLREQAWCISKGRTLLRPWIKSNCLMWDRTKRNLLKILQRSKWWVEFCRWTLPLRMELTKFIPIHLIGTKICSQEGRKLVIEITRTTSITH